MTVRILKHEIEGHVSPQAIIWRPLRYFTTQIADGQDELDAYIGASFAMGNDIRFDLRHYRGHPALTVSIYLPQGETDLDRINEILDVIIREMAIPPTAIAWRRGQHFEYGKLERPAQDRLFEPEARILVLKIAVQQPNHTATTSFLKRQIPDYTELSPRDRVRSITRPNEEMWQQIVGNVRVHEKSSKGPFVNGYAVLAPKGLTVTKAGALYLSNMGFLSLSASDLTEYLDL